jgi:hypothetical protein
MQHTDKSPICQILASMNRDTREYIETTRSTVECLVKLMEYAARIRMELNNIN